MSEPRRISGYRLETLLHDGSGGAIWRAASPHGGKLALRVLDADPGPAPPALRHERVIAVKGVLRDDAPPFALLMELAPGTDLHRHLQARRKSGTPMAVSSALRIAIDVARALVQLDRAELPRGDVDLGAVLVDRKGRARLLGWRRPRQGGPYLAGLLFEALTLQPASALGLAIERLNPRVTGTLAALVNELAEDRVDIAEAASRLEGLQPAPPAATNLQATKCFRDSVHGDMEFDGGELALIDTPEFQRLREIRQLGSTCLVYHDAIHTRFSHSLGAAHTSRRMMAEIEARGDFRFSPEEKRAVAVHALLHDVTHVPFGHTLEDERAVFTRHDRNTARVHQLVVDSELGEQLRAQGLGEAVEALLTKGAELPVPHFVKDLIDAPISCDVLDYIRRDATFCGLEIGYDPRLFSLLTIREVGGEMRLVLDLQRKHLKRYDGLSEVVNMMRARYFLFERVYAHHAKVRAGAMLSKAVELALAAPEPLREDELLGFGDETFLFHLEHDPRYQAAPQAHFIKRLLGAYRRRRLYKSCYVLQHAGQMDGRVDAEAQRGLRDLVSRFHEDRDARAEAEALIGREAGIPAEDLIIYCPAEGMASKRADIPVLRGGEAGEVTSLADVHDPELETLRANHRRLWTFFVLVHPEHEDRRERIGEICEEVVGSRNEVRDVVGRGQLALPI